jgi:hypothetical protein
MSEYSFKNSSIAILRIYATVSAGGKRPTFESDCYTNLKMDEARPARPGYGRNVWVFFVLSAFVARAAAQTSPPPEAPQALVKAAVANEVTANNNPAKHMFRSRKQTPKGTLTRLYVETSDAMAAILIALNDKPISPAQQQAEDGHLAWLANNPEQLRKKRAREKEDDEHTLRIVKALPDAFHYEYAGTENSGPGIGRAGDTLVRLKFTPNRSYIPPSREEEVLAGMEGYLLIDPQAKRLAKIDGTLYRDVTFGWGIVGRLDKGGHFLVRQADVGDGTWDITEMNLDIKGKILLVKSLTMVSDEVLSDFQRVPDSTSFAQGVKLLQSEEQKLARSDRVPEPAQQ